MYARDQQLLAAWQAGDGSSGSALVRRYWPDLVRFFVAVTGGDRSAAEDLAQDTFMTVVAHRDDIHTTFRAYAYGVARMKRFEAGRRRRARAREASLDDELFRAGGEVSRDDQIHAKRAITVLRRLEPDVQLLIVLKDYLGFTQPELAETFKIPQTRVAGRINRARRRFRAEFERLELEVGDLGLTTRSVNTALASIIARFPTELALKLKIG